MRPFFFVPLVRVGWGREEDRVGASKEGGKEGRKGGMEEGRNGGRRSGEGEE